eukprot:4425439-Prorocentrum_lima.AAC.1
MTSSLVGSEMCIRDREIVMSCVVLLMHEELAPEEVCHRWVLGWRQSSSCLLYTSDAADDM